VEVFAATLPTLKFNPGVHINYAETVLPLRDGLPKFKDFPAELADQASRSLSNLYVILIYIPTFARTQLHLPLDQAFLAQSVVLTPICGLLSDLVGRKPMLIAALVLDFVVTYPLFSWVSASPSFGALLTMQIILYGLFGVFNGPISTALAEQFPTRVRSTALAISYNIAGMLFGGFA